MMNTLGKSLVFFNLLLAGVFFAFALAVFTDRVDWGWKEPALNLGERVPSEIDKHVIALEQSREAVRNNEEKLKKAQSRINLAEYELYDFHLWAANELERMFAANKDIDLKKIEEKNGKPVFIKNTGRPLQKDPVIFQYNDGTQDHQVPVKKSFQSYFSELLGLEKQVVDLNQELVGEYDKQAKMTLRLIGETDPITKIVKTPGFYHLLEREKKQYRQLQNEIDDIRPMWVRKLVNAQLLLERRKHLLARLNELKLRLAGQSR